MEILRATDDYKIISNLDGEEYRSMEGISSTGIKAILKSPAHFRFMPKKPQTPAQEFGVLAHEATFEPHKFIGSFVIAPDVRRGTKAWTEFEEAHKGKRILKQEDADAITGIAEAISKHPLASTLITGGIPETSFFAKCPVTGVMRKVRPDFLRDDDIIVDLKTTADASFNSFQRDAARYKYQLSAAYYIDSVNLCEPSTKKSEFVIIAAEKEPPFGVMVYVYDKDAIEQGRRQYMGGLKLYRDCKLADKWPCYPETAQTLTLPMWAEYEVH